jgi:hypothetical protein
LCSGTRRRLRKKPEFVDTGRITGCTEYMQTRKRPGSTAARKAPGVVVRAGDGGSQYARVVELQQTAGNRAVSIALRGGPASVNLHGETKGNYDGGQSVVSKPKVVRAKGCECPDEDPCLRATGTIAVKYHVDVDINMPSMPDGLSECQQRRVQTFLRDVLGPHEREHAKRLRTYNGTTNRPYSVTGCGRAGLESELATKLQEMHDTESASRATAADNLSAAIDPFVRPIDLDCD